MNELLPKIDWADFSLLLNSPQKVAVLKTKEHKRVLGFGFFKKQMITCTSVYLSTILPEGRVNPLQLQEVKQETKNGKDKILSLNMVPGQTLGKLLKIGECSWFGSIGLSQFPLPWAYLLSKGILGDTGWGKERIQLTCQQLHRRGTLARRPRNCTKEAACLNPETELNWTSSTKAFKET